MATLRRTHPPLKSRSISGSKRPRSPDHSLDVPPKRQKPVPAPSKEIDKEKARRHAQREQQRLEFKEKYRRAFPSWKFYFDTDNIHPDNVSAVKLAQAKIRQLGGVRIPPPSSLFFVSFTDATLVYRRLFLKQYISSHYRPTRPTRDTHRQQRE
jgi:hypothetical protein